MSPVSGGLLLRNLSHEAHGAGRKFPLDGGTECAERAYECFGTRCRV